MKVDGRTFVVSGGASGLGKGTAETLSRSGAYVAIFDLAASEELIQQFPAGKAKFFKVDVTSNEQLENAIAETVQWAEKNQAPLGGVICCAGVLVPGKIINSKFDPLPLSNLQLAINVNILGTINLVRLLVPHIAQLPASLDPGHESERGVIVLVSSAAAYDGQAGSLAYAATKGAIRSVTLPLARDLSRYGIRAVSIAPNMFETPMTSKDKMPEKVRRSLENTFEFPRRSGRPAEEFGGLVMEIMRNRMLNGCDVRIDGGTRLMKL